MYPYCLVSSTGLVATFTDKEAKLWDCKTFKEVKKFGGHEEEVLPLFSSLLFSSLFFLFFLFHPC
jgi:hypothetical protein